MLKSSWYQLVVKSRSLTNIKTYSRRRGNLTLSNSAFTLKVYFSPLSNSSMGINSSFSTEAINFFASSRLDTSMGLSSLSSSVIKNTFFRLSYLTLCWILRLLIFLSSQKDLVPLRYIENLYSNHCIYDLK